MSKRLTLGKKPLLLGVCSGFAEYFDIDVTFIRFVYLILVFCFGVGILPYFIAWLLMPKN